MENGLADVVEVLLIAGADLDLAEKVLCKIYKIQHTVWKEYIEYSMLQSSI